MKKISKNAIVIKIDGEGICDFCNKNVKGTIFCIDKYGDACPGCFKKLQKQNNKINYE